MKVKVQVQLLSVPLGGEKYESIQDQFETSIEGDRSFFLELVVDLVKLLVNREAKRPEWPSIEKEDEGGLSKPKPEVAAVETPKPEENNVPS